MVFALHKFRYYLLGNKFVFYVKHMALVYLVSTPQVSRKITRWLLLSLEYDFIVVYKPGRTHVIGDALSRLPNITKPVGVLNQTKVASLFYREPERLNDVKEVLKTCQMEGTLLVQQKQILVKIVEPFTLKNGELYRMGQDNRLQRCLRTTYSTRNFGFCNQNSVACDTCNYKFVQLHKTSCT